MLPARLAWLPRARWPARLAYLVVLLIATLTPFIIDIDGGRIVARLADAFRPGVSGVDAIDGARNIVLFAGWGAVWALTGRGALLRVLGSATLTGMLVSVTVETLQLFSDNRKASILDVFTNTTGAFIGALVLVLMVVIARERKGAKSYLGIPALTFAGAYGASVTLEAIIPLFRQLPLEGAGGGPIGRAAAAFAAFSLGSIRNIPLEDLPLFLPAGALAVAALAELGHSYRDAMVKTAVWGSVLMGFAELGHAPLALPIELGSIILHSGGIALGAWAAARGLPALTNALRGAQRARAFYIGYAVLLAIWSWRPWHPEFSLNAILAKFATEWWMPLGMLSGRVDLFSVVDVCLPFFLFLPVGALLGVWPLAHREPLNGPLPGIWLSLALEVGQVFVAGRSLDVTDVLVQVSGVLIGFTIIRRAGYGVYGVVMRGER